MAQEAAGGGGGGGQSISEARDSPQFSTDKADLARHSDAHL